MRILSVTSLLTTIIDMVDVSESGITAVTLLKFLPVFAILTLVLGISKIWYVYRARAMRRLAASSGLNYIGLAAPKWWPPSHPRGSPPLPGWFSQACQPSGRRISQVWNVIEGYQNGVSVLIFDCILGEVRGSAPCTVIACQTEQNPFGLDAQPYRVIQTHGWTVLHGVWFLWFSWTMRLRRSDHYVKKVRVGLA